MEEPKPTPVLKPGMSHVVHGGERLVIRDEESQEIEIVGRENAKVMAFLVAYDNLREADEAGITGPVTDMLKNEVKAAFLSLPNHVIVELPSYGRLAASAGGGTVT